MREAVTIAFHSPQKDFVEAFYRNVKAWPPNNRYPDRDPENTVPVSYYFAERLDPAKQGIPRASYFILDPRTEGEPIAERVADSLEKLFERQTGESGTHINLDHADDELNAALKREQEGDWSAAVHHAANAYAEGGDNEKKAARYVLSRVAGAARDYRSFSPAPSRNTIPTPQGDISVPSYLSKDDTRRYKEIAQHWRSK
jgi:hypothetical protein